MTTSPTGKGSIEPTTGDQALRWSSMKDYYSLVPNQVIDREVCHPLVPASRDQEPTDHTPDGYTTILESVA